MALIIGQAKSQSPCCKKYFPESQSDVFRCCFCPATCPKPKDFSCTVTNNELKQKILTFKKLDPANLGDFFAVIKNHKGIINTVVNLFYFNQLIVAALNTAAYIFVHMWMCV